ncbi:MAG TPA: hypothetical protein DDY31_06760 [Lachnospiraceae bacterium]|nr:hypothetical protein [Lachnospiraceae bacterium]
MINRVVELLKQEGFVNDENDQIVMAGLQKMMHIVLDIIFTVLCSWSLGDIMAGLVYGTAYGILRVYAGGYHAKSKTVCTILTYLSIIVSLTAIFYVPYHRHIIYFLLAICIGVIVCTAPVESVNKPLSKLEKKMFYRYCIGILLAEVLLCCIFVRLGFSLYAKAVSVAILQVVIGMGVVKRK